MNKHDKLRMRCWPSCARPCLRNPARLLNPRGQSLSSVSSETDDRIHGPTGEGCLQGPHVVASCSRLGSGARRGSSLLLPINILVKRILQHRASIFKSQKSQQKPQENTEKIQPSANRSRPQAKGGIFLVKKAAFLPHSYGPISRRGRERGTVLARRGLRSLRWNRREEEKEEVGRCSNGERGPGRLAARRPVLLLLMDPAANLGRRDHRRQ